MREYTCPDESAEDDTETRPATAPDSETEAAELLANPTSSKDAETITASGKTESADSPSESAVKRHDNPPWPPYYSAAHDDINIRENQSLTCVTLSQIEPFSGEENIIHICDAPQFIAKLSAFQEFRSQLNKYKGQT